jgi:hypothetical protein
VEIKGILFFFAPRDILISWALYIFALSVLDEVIPETLSVN